MDLLFFWLSKLIWLLISPDSLLILLFSIGVYLLIAGYTRWAKRVLVSLLAVFLFIGFLPVGEWFFYPLEKRFTSNSLPENVDGIILLGGAEDASRTASWNQPVLNSSAERSIAFIELAKKYPMAKMVFTGGGASLLDQQFRGADVAKQLFSQHGLSLSQIIFEGESRNTWENATLSKKIVQPKTDESWILITSAFHMPRSLSVFCKASWKVTPYAVDFRSNPESLLRVNWNFSYHLDNLKLGTKEWVGLFAYRFTGRACNSD